MTQSPIFQSLEKVTGKVYCVDVAGFYVQAFMPVSLFYPSS